MPIVWSNEDKKHYVVPGTKCSKCSITFQKHDPVMVKIFSSPRRTMFFCKDCVDLSKKLGEPEQKFWAEGVQKVPSTSIVVDELHRPALVSGELSVWDSETITRDALVIDKTKYAGREEYSKMPPPVRPSIEDEMKRLDRPVNEDEMLRIFASKPVKSGFNLLDHVIPPNPEEKAKQIQNKEEK